jgi:hypothetical protein
MRVARSFETTPFYLVSDAWIEKSVRFILDLKMENHGTNTALRHHRHGIASSILPNQLRLELGWRSAYYE